MRHSPRTARRFETGLWHRVRGAATCSEPRADSPSETPPHRLFQNGLRRRSLERNRPRRSLRKDPQESESRNGNSTKEKTFSHEFPPAEIGPTSRSLGKTSAPVRVNDSIFLGTAGRISFCIGKKDLHELSTRAVTILGALAAAPCVIAQTESTQSEPSLSAAHFETKSSDLNPIFPMRAAEATPFDARPNPRGVFQRTGLCSSAPQSTAPVLADMHQALEVQNNSWWSESDPLARPFARLPAPAYYATGLALATGVNWLS
jgi:hypothetical protein